MTELLKKENRKKLKISLVLLTVYTISFYLIEGLKLDYKLVDSPLDDKIPFIEYFLPFYCYWFIYLFRVSIYFVKRADERDFTSYIAMLFGGMMLCLLIYLIFPNMVDLRPAVLERDNIMSRIVKIIYRIDTPTNVNPSIHVYATLAALLCSINFSSMYKNKIWLLCFDVTMSILIILSTVFLKQHSVIDIATGFLLVAVNYISCLYLRKISLNRGKSKGYDQIEEVE